MKDPTRRFANRVENYVKYRPGYPPAMIEYLRELTGLSGNSAAADIGSGTGIFAKQLLLSGARVFGVEPNAPMRSAAEVELGSDANFHSIDGTAETTNLPDASIDTVTAAQAFHWFDRTAARAEFRRILRPSGWIVLVWNERKLDATPFLGEYEKFLLKYASDYTIVRHDNIDDQELLEFFGGDFETREFANAQTFSYEGLLGRVLSSSYMPTHKSSNFDAMADELGSLFAKYSEKDTIEVLYSTKVYSIQG